MNTLELFYQQLQADVIADAQAGEPGSGDFKENTFTRIVTDDLAAAGVLEAPIVCYCEHGTGNTALKVNGYCIPDEDTCLDLVISAYYHDAQPRRLASADLKRFLNQAVRYLRETAKGYHERLEPGSEAYAMTREIHRQKEAIDRVRIILITNGLAVARKEVELKERQDSWTVAYDIWDLERLRRFRTSGATHEPVEADLSNFDGGIRCVVAGDQADGFLTCAAILPGIILHDWYDEYSSRILELNVRSYLQARGKINAKILETILREPERFLSYNNGITIVAEEIRFNAAGDRITGLKGLQIVNGGQTTASIHRAKKESRADLSRVFVQAKITVVPADLFESVVPLISQYSNTQNKISEADLRANNSFHVGIERVAMATWTPGEQYKWFYERSRGSYQTQRTAAGSSRAARDKFDRQYPAKYRFTKEELARYLNTWNGQAPVANLGAQKNFVKFMDTLPRRAKDWAPSLEEFREIVAKAILFRETQRIARERRILAFGINIVIYTVALLAEKTARRIDFQAIWNRQGLPPELANLIGNWLEKVGAQIKESAGVRNPSDWFKLDDCWRQLKTAAAGWPLPTLVSTQLVVTEGISSYLAESEHNDIARCLQVKAETWVAIQLWGSQHERLQDWEIGIVSTLAGYAATNWRRKPSPKQAKHGVRVLQLYQDAVKEE